MLELCWSCLDSPLLFSPHQDFDFTRLAIDINQILYPNHQTGCGGYRGSRSRAERLSAAFLDIARE